MIKLKKILKESSPGFENRKFGDALPTLDSVKASYDSKNGTIQEDNLNEESMPMDKKFMKDWEKSCNALINHLKNEIKEDPSNKRFFKNLLNTVVDARVVPYNMAEKLGTE